MIFFVEKSTLTLPLLCCMVQTNYAGCRVVRTVCTSTSTELFSIICYYDVFFLTLYVPPNSNPCNLNLCSSILNPLSPSSYITKLREPHLERST